MSRLFQSFSQVGASTTRKYGGTGLGPAISKRLVELMGDSIWVESRQGYGSTFHFTIRAQAAQLQQQAKPTPAASLKDMRILIVDDMEINRRILTLQAQSWVMLLTAFANPVDALEAIQRGARFDIAVLDMNMPEMDGTTLSKEIRKHNLTIPLIMLTSANAMQGDREDCIAAGMDDYLSKPIQVKKLQAAIERVARAK